MTVVADLISRMSTTWLLTMRRTELCWTALLVARQDAEQDLLVLEAEHGPDAT